MTKADIPQTVSRLRGVFDGGQTRPYQWRRTQLEQLRAMIEENEDAICGALHADLGKSRQEAYLTEVGFILAEIDHALKNLKSWMRPENVSTPLSNQPGKSSIVHEPLGVVLIIAPWNYPFHLIASPLIGALCAGNCAVLKPSELTPTVSALLSDCLERYLDPEAIRVVEGGAETATDLLAQRFDHIFFTGSTRIGKIVMAAAAKHLTPVTLELGGKSPCIVNADADLEVAARRIAWGKYLNAGQTCVAPDYVLAHDGIAEELAALLEASVRAFFGSDIKASPDFARIVNERHFDRLTALMGCGDILFGGETDRSERYIAPTALGNVAAESPIMQEEIFGPILPILTVPTVDDAIAFVNERPRPLSLYLFSADGAVHDAVTKRTSSGSVCINEVVMQLAVPELPFGGVGASGMGAYHGRTSFETFSHAKAVLNKTTRFDVPLRYPPYSESAFKWLRRLM